MKIRFFDSFEQYENSHGSSAYETVFIIMENGWTKGDMFTECKQARTAIKRFFKMAGGLPGYDGWEACILESIENGCYKQNDFTMGDGTRNPEPSWSWELEEIDDGEWYFFLNVRP